MDSRGSGNPYEIRKTIMEKDMKKIALVGSPNVGKSSLFNALTNKYVIVSNYPGTTVELTKGKLIVGGTEYELVDTPGMYSLLPVTEEERVARDILIKDKPDIVLHVADARNLERMLPLTLQLIEAAVPVILVLNIMDEADKEGISIDFELLEKELGIPVVQTVSTTGKGMDDIKERIRDLKVNTDILIEYSPGLAIKRIAGMLKSEYSLSKRAMALLLIQGDDDIREMIKAGEGPDPFKKIETIIKEIEDHYVSPIPYEVAVERYDKVRELIEMTVKVIKKKLPFRERISRLMMNPVTGLPVLFLVLYFGLYKFVGVFGAGTVVDFLEGTIFEGYINPAVTGIAEKIIPWAVLQDLFVGEYGLITLGVRYAVALILPIVTFFFIVFSIIEDTGYLPRLAMLIDRTFKKIGLSGRAVIPMVLGLGCDTMATMVTRTLPTTRERVISTILLALAVPCSAQLGVILAILEGNPAAMMIWAGVICLIFLFVGFLTSMLLPGEKPSFYMELPPLRMPSIVNVLRKTYARVKWYLYEVMPIFLFASVMLWLGQLTRVFDILINILKKPTLLIGLPAEAAQIFLFGFFRRDYGVAGLYDLNKQGVLDGRQLVVACVALTLFLPCVAQLLMNVKERGWKVGVAISFFVLFFSFGVSFVLNQVLVKFGILL